MYKYCKIFVNFAVLSDMVSDSNITDNKPLMREAILPITEFLVQGKNKQVFEYLIIQGSIVQTKLGAMLFSLKKCNPMVFYSCCLYRKKHTDAVGSLLVAWDLMEYTQTLATTNFCKIMQEER